MLIVSDLLSAVAIVIAAVSIRDSVRQGRQLREFDRLLFLVESGQRWHDERLDGLETTTRSLATGSETDRGERD